MGRPGSTLAEVLPVLHEAGVGAFSLGFVSGRTQTIWPWTTWLIPDEDDEPDPWFHDLLREDGSPYAATETRNPDPSLSRLSWQGEVPVVWIWLASVGNVAAADLLMLGNSYTQVNSLEILTADLFEAANGSRPDALALVSGGLTFADHVDRINDDSAGNPWADALGAGSTQAHGVIVLQEQSQIPGFPDDSSELVDSRAAALTLDAAAQAHGGETLFLMSWGRREGDPTNADRYPDFLTMQGHLAQGYLAYVAQTSTEDRPTFVAPVGLAFQAAYEDTASASGDPLEPTGLFWQLYSADGSHPSVAGSYLAACVIYASLTGQSPVGLGGAPEAVDADLRATLQALAARTVLEDTPELLYPWEVDAPVDTGGRDTGAGGEDGGSGDGAGDGGAAPAATESTACGCQAGGRGAAGGLALLGMGLAWRRRRDPHGVAVR